MKGMSSLPMCVVLAGNIRDYVCQKMSVPLCVLLNTAHIFLFFQMIVCVWIQLCHLKSLWKSQSSNKQPKQSKSYINWVHNPINLFGFIENPLQIWLFFFPSTLYIIVLLFLSAGGFAYDRVEKRVNVCSGCALSDPIDLIQQDGNVEIWTLLAAVYCSILKPPPIQLCRATTGTIGEPTEQWKTLGKQKPPPHPSP